MNAAALTFLAETRVDGFFGNYATSWIGTQHSLHLISKLRHDAALYFPYSGSKPRRGPTLRYADRLAYAVLPTQACCSSIMKGRFVNRISPSGFETYSLPCCIRTSSPSLLTSSSSSKPILAPTNAHTSSSSRPTLTCRRQTWTTITPYAFKSSSTSPMPSNPLVWRVS